MALNNTSPLLAHAECLMNLPFFSVAVVSTSYTLSDAFVRLIVGWMVSAGLSWSYCIFISNLIALSFIFPLIRYFQDSPWEEPGLPPLRKTASGPDLAPLATTVENDEGPPIKKRKPSTPTVKVANGGDGFFGSAERIVPQPGTSLVIIKEPTDEVQEEDRISPRQHASKAEAPDWRKLFKYRRFYLLCLLAPCLSFIRETWNDWGTIYLVNDYGISKGSAGMLTLVYPLMGTGSLLLAGYALDAVKGKNKGLVATGFLVAELVTLGGLAGWNEEFVKGQRAGMAIVLVGLSGLFLFGM